MEMSSATLVWSMLQHPTGVSLMMALVGCNKWGNVELLIINPQWVRTTYWINIKGMNASPVQLIYHKRGNCHHAHFKPSLLQHWATMLIREIGTLRYEGIY